MTQQVRTPAGRRRGLDPKVAEAFLRQKESALRTQLLAFLVLGVPLSFVAPLAIALGSQLWARLSHREPPDFWRTFALVSAIAIPILYGLAAVLKGSLLERAADAYEGSVVSHMGANRGVLVLMLMDVANIGPRMVLHALRRRWERREGGTPDFARAAQAVVTLADAGEGIPTSRLQLPGEPGNVLADVLELLKFHDVADTSKDGRRAWLCSTAAQKLGVKRV